MSKSIIARPLISMAALAAASASPAAAQTVTQGSEDIVVTAQRNNQTQVVDSGSLGVLGLQDAMNTPFAVKSYSDTLILNQQPYTLGQVLENDPSVRTSLGFGNASEQFVIRGFPLYGEDIAIDGLFGITPRQLVSPELYDQVQILNGASAFLFGAAPGGTALGGTVNLMPKRARAKDINRITANYLSDEHFGGAFDYGRRFGENDSFGVRINGAGRWGDVSVDDEYRSSVVLGTGFDYRGERLRLSLDLAYQRVKVQHMRPMVQLAGVTAVPAVPAADINYGQNWNYTTLRDIFGIAKLEYDITDKITFYAMGGARDSAERGYYQGFNVTNAQTGAAYVTGSNIPRNDNNEAAQAGIRARFATGPLSHEVNLGGAKVWQVNRNAYEFGTFSPDATNASNLYAPSQIALPTFNVFTGGNLADPFAMNRTQLTSLFASDTIGLLDDKVKIVAGARWQKINFKTYCGGAVFFGFHLDSCVPGAFVSQYEKSATTPVIGLVVHPTEHFSFYANRIEALLQGPTAPSGTINANTVFPPYKAVQYEAGAKFQFGRWNASAAVYQTEMPQTFVSANVFTLDGQQRNKGVEFTFNGEPVKGLRIITGLSIAEAKQTRTQGGTFDGKWAIGVPDYTANANVEWDLGFLPGVTLTGRVMQTGKQYVDQGNTLVLPEWTRFDLGARYVIAVHDVPVTFRANVDNVANNRYWASSLGGYLVQGLPRTYKASVTIDY
ncbi:TonB-dependent siderophore receptor [Novosphingobium flavum]|uniref:TonB-dependent siderophore receptor n=1 Tax=Novosphingobium flavum TaxID=1778672 RepID=A0A7X1FRA6_9SPHN|nr:TonB-dependent siderophore receptor [Novosphingobium flavum]MBC2665530.1 TonB-dependent siderophore receptor [Novosphingobium flavum]